MKLSFILTLLLITSNVLAANFPDLKGEFIIIVSVDVNIEGFEAKCGKKSLKNDTWKNLIPFGEEENVILNDEIECEGKPNFNIIGLRPTGYGKTAFKVILGRGTGSSEGNFEIKEKNSFMMTCSYREHGWEEVDKGTITCTFNNNSRSIIKAAVD